MKYDSNNANRCLFLFSAGVGAGSAGVGMTATMPIVSSFRF